MKTTRILMYFFLVFATVAFTACSEDGEDGIDGVNGVDGAPGPQGPPGEDGEDGNANVIASEWIPSEFSMTGTTFDSFDVADDRITQEVIDSAAIIVFGQIDGTTAISIPFVFSNRSYYFAPFASSSFIRFIGVSLNGSNQVFSDISAVRYVIIPASSTEDFTESQSPEEALIAAGVDVKDYYAVMDYFGLTY